MTKLSLFGFKLLVVVITFLISGCAKDNTVEYQLAYDHIKSEMSEDSICVDELLIHPIYQQFKYDLARVLNDWIDTTKLGAKVYLEETNVEIFLREAMEEFSYDYSEGGHRLINPCIHQSKTLFFSNLNEGLLYASLVDTENIISRNSKVVTFRGKANVYLFFFDGNEPKISQFLEKEVSSFNPPSAQ